MKNILCIADNVTDAQKNAIDQAITQHNGNLYDGKDYVEPDVEYGADYTCVEGRESESLQSFFYGIINIIEERA